MFDDPFDSGSIDCTHVAGLTYVAICHPLARGLDIIQSETGQIVQTITLDGVKEVTWSANSSHLALLIHVVDISAGSRSVDAISAKRISTSAVLETYSKLGSTELDGLGTEKYEIRVYSCNDRSTALPPEWSLWKAVPAPLYTSDFQSKLGYSHSSFCFPLLTLSVTSSLYRTESIEKLNTSTPDLSVLSSLNSKVVLLDVNVCVFDEVLLFLPDGEGDSIQTLGEKRIEIDHFFLMNFSSE